MNVPEKKPIYVIGHKNPDTDSICSAISYAHLKNKIVTTTIFLCVQVKLVMKRISY